MSYHVYHDRLATPQFLWWSVQPAAGDFFWYFAKLLLEFLYKFQQIRGTFLSPEASKSPENLPSKKPTFH